VIFQLLTLIALESIKEKTVRIIIQVFKNLILKAPQENIIPMLAVKTLKTLTLLKQRKWTDEDLMEDILFIETELQGHVDSLT
jgi:V-type H+-transporting ATPase subunit H